jgi:hypothetical protein
VIRSGVASSSARRRPARGSGPVRDPRRRGPGHLRRAAGRAQGPRGPDPRGAGLRLLFVGDGPMRADSAAGRDPRGTAAGHPEILAASDIVALPSRFGEGCPTRCSRRWRREAGGRGERRDARGRGTARRGSSMPLGRRRSAAAL